MIRKANLKDVDIINDLGGKIIANFINTYDINKYLLSDNYLIFVNEDEHINAFLIISENITSYELEVIYVSDEYRHHGIASNLINYFLDNFYNQKKDIFLEVSVENTMAIKLYQKFGFTIINKRKNYYHGIDAYVMKKVK